MLSFKVVASAILCIFHIVSCEFVHVDVVQGRLKGLKCKTLREQKTFYSFKGIPYAQPRIGHEKFSSPEPAVKWNGVLDATEHQSHCYYYCSVRKKAVGSDDCLYMNIFTPQIDATAVGKAVIVFVHPGSYNIGSGNENIYGADHFIDQGVIVVTFNYRLGATGFLSTNDKNAPGNNGLKDQVFALRWVKSNIKKFGGDPDKITLMGDDGSAGSVQLHMSSAMSTGLFNKAVLLGGSNVASWAINYNPVDIALKLGRAVGIETQDTAQLIKKLREIDTEKLVMASEVLANQEKTLSGRFYAFAPNVEPNAGQQAFLTDDPFLTLKYGNISDIPVIIGVSRDQGTFLVPGILANGELANAPYEEFIPSTANITDVTLRKRIGNSIRDFYFDGKPATAKTEENLDKIMTDVSYYHGVAITSKILSTRISSPVYEYLFSYDGPWGHYKKFFKMSKGVMQFDVLFYMFYSRAVDNVPTPGSEEEKVLLTIVKLLTNFAKEGNPTPKLDKDVNIEWLPVKNGKNCMIIDKNLTMHDYVNKERIKFWADIYKPTLGEFYQLFV